MTRGPIPKPKAINDLKGDTHKRRRHTTEPEPPKTKPTCPEHLDEIAKVQWRHTAEQLELMGLLSGADAMALEMFAAAYSRYRQAEAKVNEGLGVMPGKDTGFPMITAYQTIMNQNLEVCRRYQLEYGLTPGARARLAVPNQPKEDGKWKGILDGNL